MKTEQKEIRDKIIAGLLTPLSWIYGFVTDVRNKLYDKHILKSESFDVPVVCVGNITVGGTGKTPHVEFLLDYFSSIYRIGVVSRGYKRSTKGFVIANRSSTPSTIGDEPYQIYSKFGHRVRVAACENRVAGIKELLKIHPDINLIILDDAFQHRSVRPKVSVLLMDYSRPICDDKLLPLGRLRESPRSSERADFVVVTKCPDGLAPIDYRIISKKLDLYAFQKLFFSKYVYGRLTPVFPDDNPYTASMEMLDANDTVLLLTGIAYPRHFVRHFSTYECHLKVSCFPDHHSFTRKDLADIEKKFNSMSGNRKIIVTTEKDAVRLATNPYFPSTLKPLIFFIPIKVEVVARSEGSDFIQDLRKSIDEKSMSDSPQN